MSEFSASDKGFSALMSAFLTLTSHDLIVLQPHKSCPSEQPQTPNPELVIWSLRGNSHLKFCKVPQSHMDWCRSQWSFICQRRGSSRASSADSLIGFLQWVTFVLQKDNQWDWPIWETKETSEMGCGFTEEYLTLYKQINVLLASNRMYQRNDSSRANQGNSLPLFTSKRKCNLREDNNTC